MMKVHRLSSGNCQGFFWIHLSKKQEVRYIFTLKYSWLWNVRQSHSIWTEFFIYTNHENNAIQGWLIARGRLMASGAWLLPLLSLATTFLIMNLAYWYSILRESKPFFQMPVLLHFWNTSGKMQLLDFQGCFHHVDEILFKVFSS